MPTVVIHCGRRVPVPYPVMRYIVSLTLASHYVTTVEAEDAAQAAEEAIDAATSMRPGTLRVPQHVTDVAVQQVPDPPSDEPLLLTMEQAAKRLGIGRTGMYELVNAKKLKTVTIGKLRRVRTEDLERYVAGLRAT